MGSEAPHIDIDENSISHFETIVMPIPQYDAENPSMISQGPSVCIFNKEDPGEVLASWLFVQYLLTDKVQIAYSQTEGYVPVTQKAQSNPSYQNYLSRSGERDSNGKAKALYYSVKIDAAKLLLDNVDNSFVTPVFNGSVSLRNAAGQMIEEVVKSAYRRETIDEKYIDDLFADMVSLYRLDNIVMEEGDPPITEPEGLPGASIALLASIGGVWCLLVGAFIFERVKNSKQKSQK